MRYLLILLSINAFASERPAWIEGGRHVSNGYICHTAAASNENTQKAMFRAEVSASRMVADECSLPSKEIVIWKRYTEANTAFAQACIDFGSCEEAKTANEAKRKKLSNPRIIDNERAVNEEDNPKQYDKETIEKTMQDGFDKVIEKIDDRNTSLEALRTHLKQLEQMVNSPREVVQREIVTQRTIVYADQPNANNYAHCMVEYQQMHSEYMDIQNRMAQPNLAQEPARSAYNRANVKLQYCQGLH